jgi:hypothetical protein
MPAESARLMRSGAWRNAETRFFGNARKMELSGALQESH